MREVLGPAVRLDCPRARSSSVAVGSHALEKPLFLNAPRKCLVGSLSGKKLCDINKRLKSF